MRPQSLDDADLLLGQDADWTNPAALFDPAGAIGGFGTYVMQTLAEEGLLDRGGLKVRMMVLPDVFIDQDSPNAMYAQAGLDAKGIVVKVFEALGRDRIGTVKRA